MHHLPHNTLGRRLMLLGSAVLLLNLQQGCALPLNASSPPAQARWSAAAPAVVTALDHHRRHTVQRVMHLQARVQLAQAVDRGHHAAKAAPRPRGKVMLIGDSMAGRLSRPLKALMDAGDGVTAFRSLHEVNDALHAWKRNGLVRLRSGLQTEQPDTVVVVMGTNDFLHPDVEQLTSTIAAVESAIAPRPCYWVGPPRLWTRDTGIVELLRSRTTHCAYLDSEPLTIARGRDGWHPSPTGSAQWAQAIWGWIQTHPVATHNQSGSALSPSEQVTTAAQR
ncbi:MAG: hypothetical protein AAFS10_23825 [Myxococcota bacterium]